ncbi:hypothetical protein PsAD2_04521 [Pseudovibrio axinellae]|uniref:NnrT protein n=1 Tax=Pseudovibrio axinellae TaxID=989403 RepID=A0A165T1G6_9HYPH|nr:hypothetical protein [Pseudovibrio axinellae]KZL05166.1 hypothetical protein PsAD2_04521 [Pseudovibrio axinellae]SER50758.1 hypothetical protein SAMN05421798_11183 [Pseudovibrio axinellae]
MWSVKKLAIVLYPFAMLTVAINLFFATLIGTFFDLPAMSPYLTLWVSLPLGIPASWLAAKWVRSLLEQAQEK